MPRSARLDAPGVLHHVMGRGIEKKKIFLTDQDREDFVSRLEELVRQKALKIYAWALLPNHFHLLCKTQNYPLSSSMRKLLTGYAVNFNKRHKRVGHLFQNRYKSIICQEDRYLKELVRYIHLNPLRTKTVKSLAELNRYPWSGHSALLGKRKRDWQDTEYVLSYFGLGTTGIQKYLEFVREGIPMGKRPDLVGGGLRRSTAPWSTVVPKKGRKEKPLSDERILGDGDFVEEILSRMDTFDRETLRLPPLSQGFDPLGKRNQLLSPGDPGGIEIGKPPGPRHPSPERPCPHRGALLGIFRRRNGPFLGGDHLLRQPGGRFCQGLV